MSSLPISAGSLSLMGLSLYGAEEPFLGLLAVSGCDADEDERFLCVVTVGPFWAAPIHTVKRSENHGIILPADYLSGLWPWLWRDTDLFVVHQHCCEAGRSLRMYL